jgi:hypothetical protein
VHGTSPRNAPLPVAGNGLTADDDARIGGKDQIRQPGHRLHPFQNRADVPLEDLHQPVPLLNGSLRGDDI